MADNATATAHEAAKAEAAERSASSTARAAKGTAKVQAPKITPKQAGFSLLRPFKLAYGFLAGTSEHTLNGIATGGRRGMWVGLAIGLLAAVGGAGILAPLMIGALGGALTGIGVGGGLGLATGGIRGVRREMRAEKYADNMAERKATARPARGAAPFDFRGYRETNAERNSILTDRLFNQNMENNRDTTTYWQDRVASQGSSWSKGV